MTTKSAKKKPAQPAKAWFPGKMGTAEIKPLVMAARAAFDYQEHLGMTDGESFDDWRRAQVLAVTGRGGLSQCQHAHFQPLMGHFQTLAGNDAEAFSALMRTGKQSDSAPDDATQERARVLAHEIMTVLEAHQRLMTLPLGEIAEQIEDHAAYYAAKAAREHAERKGGAYQSGYLVRIVRDKTRRPDLKLGKDLRASLAERCSVKQLEEILYTLVNRIAAREGRGETANRNKGQRKGRKTA